MSKTPVSTLQEYMAKGALGMPEYTIIAEKNGTHLSSFTYRVKCGKLSADGTASSKKEAKHNAAKELLKLLPNSPRLSTTMRSPQSSTTMSSPVSSSLKTSPLSSYYSPNAGGIPHDDVFVNSVGKLNEHCASRKLKTPEYTVISASGPSHMMSFTIKCSIGSLSADATANTKKQAKQDAAQNMLQLLVRTMTSKTYLDIIEPETLKRCYGTAEDAMAKMQIMDLMMPELSMPPSKSSERAKELFPKLRCRDSVNIVKNVGINDYHQALKNSVTAENQQAARQKIRFFTVSSKEKVLEAVLAILNLQLKCETVVSNHNYSAFPRPNVVQHKEFAVRCTVNSSPVITDIGVGKTVAEAKEQAIASLLNSVDLLLT